MGIERQIRGWVQGKEYNENKNTATIIITTIITTKITKKMTAKIITTRITTKAGTAIEGYQIYYLQS